MVLGEDAPRGPPQIKNYAALGVLAGILKKRQAPDLIFPKKFPSRSLLPVEASKAP
jgi:hypothetical protein